jgi:opacity protein-like surface antigen
MKRSLPLILALAVVLLGIAPLTASAAIPGNYTALKLGGYFPQSDDLEDFDTGFNGEIAFGHYFTPNIAAELGIGYFKSETDTFFVFDPFIGLVTADAEVTVIPVTLNVKLAYPVGGIELYGLAGVGVYITELELSATALGLGISESDDDTAFGFNLGLGANFNITPNVYLGAEVKYLWAEPSFFDVDVKIDGVQATANIGYRF